MKVLALAVSAAVFVGLAATGAVAGEPVKNDAAATYATLKTFAGQWGAAVSTDPKTFMDGLKMALKIRVTSSGNAIVHEMGAAANQDGPEKMGDITVFYLEGDTVYAVHYCDADTRSRLKAVPSSDPKSVVFELVDVTGKTQLGYVSALSFKSDTADHHSEELSFVMPDKTVLHAKFDLQKKP